MNSRAYRSFLKAWRNGACVAVGAAALCGPAAAQTPRPLASAQPVSVDRRLTAATPAWAMTAIRAGDGIATVARLQAVDILGASNWQSDPKTEGALIFALRADSQESVRGHAAAHFAKSRSITPKVYESLQCVVTGGMRDGFGVERSASVRAQAAEALRKHPAPSGATQNEARSTRVGSQVGTAKLLSPPGAVVREGAEESMPPEPTQMMLPPSNVPTPPAPPTPPPVASVPATKAPPPPPNVKPASIVRETPAPLQPIPATLDRKPLAETPPEPMPLTDTTNMTLRERRTELRQMGLKDPTMKLFTETVGAPPPKSDGAPAPLLPRPLAGEPSSAAAKVGYPLKMNVWTQPSPAESAPAAASGSPGFFGRLFGSRPTPAAQPVPPGGEIIVPVSNSAPTRTP